MTDPRFFLVGGAVRDTLLGRAPKDRDFLVTGVTGDDLTAAGFQQVGAAFPVFLHPVTGDEHALPRGTGDGCPVVADLAARDLTVNAMALCQSTGTLVDPFGGAADVAARVLRQTGPDAFTVDPVRVLRTARLAASLGFTVAPETVKAMGDVAGALSSLVTERVFAEFRKALSTPNPSTFFQVLADAGVLSVVFSDLFAVPTVTGDDEVTRFASVAAHAADPVAFAKRVGAPSAWVDVAKAVAVVRDGRPADAVATVAAVAKAGGLRKSDAFKAAVAGVVPSLAPFWASVWGAMVAVDMAAVVHGKSGQAARDAVNAAHVAAVGAVV